MTGTCVGLGLISFYRNLYEIGGFDRCFSRLPSILPFHGLLYEMGERTLRHDVTGFFFTPSSVSTGEQVQIHVLQNMMMLLLLLRNSLLAYLVTASARFQPR